VAVIYNGSDTVTSCSYTTPPDSTQRDEGFARNPLGVHTPPCVRLELDDLGRQGHPGSPTVRTSGRAAARCSWSS
jgi:hypothetical protein